MIQTVPLQLFSLTPGWWDRILAPPSSSALTFPLLASGASSSCKKPTWNLLHRWPLNTSRYTIGFEANLLLFLQKKMLLLGAREDTDKADGQEPVWEIIATIPRLVKSSLNHHGETILKSE